MARMQAIITAEECRREALLPKPPLRLSPLLFPNNRLSFGDCHLVGWLRYAPYPRYPGASPPVFFVRKSA